MNEKNRSEKLNIKVERFESEQKIIMVTGGSGFVGINLVERLINEKNIVIVLDNFSSGSKENIHKFLNNKYLMCYEHDVTEPFSIDNVDEIYHLACQASPPHYMINPIETLKTNFIGTMNVLNLCVEHKAKFFLASTSEIYGDPIEHPQSEEYFGNVNTSGPRSCYDEGKRVSETLAYCYHQKYNVDVHIARIFNTYGPKMLENDGRVISNFITQALENRPLTIYGDGNQTRSFQYISDLIDGMVLLMKSSYHKPVNIGNPEEYTIQYLAQYIIKITGSSSNVVYLPSLEDDPHKRKPKIDTANKILGWHPKVPFDEGILLTLDYFKSLLKKKQTN